MKEPNDGAWVRFEKISILYPDIDTDIDTQ